MKVLESEVFRSFRDNLKEASEMFSHDEMEVIVSFLFATLAINVCSEFSLFLTISVVDERGSTNALLKL